MKNIKIGLICCFCTFSLILSAQLIELNLKAVRSTTGNLNIAIFADEKGFKSEKPIWESKLSKSTVQNGEIQVQIPFKAGHFGISVLDDENNSGKMEYNLLRIPREGFGFSNYYHKGLRRPKFDDFDFYIEKNERKKITVLMKYY